MTTNTPDWEGLGRELERLRKLTTISANEAGRRLGISGTQVRNFERALDKGRPSAGYLSALAELYGADPLPLLRLGGYPEQIVTNPARSVSAQPSDLPPSVTVEENGVGERSGRHLVTVRADAIGVTLTVDYDGPQDRRRALAEAMWALGIERGDNGDAGLSVPEGGDNAP